MKKQALLLAVLISATTYASQSVEGSLSFLKKTEASQQEPKQEKVKKKPSKKSKKSSAKKSAKPAESEFNSSRSNREKVD